MYFFYIFRLNWTGFWTIQMANKYNYILNYYQNYDEKTKL